MCSKINDTRQWISSWKCFCGWFFKIKNNDNRMNHNSTLIMILIINHPILSDWLDSFVKIIEIALSHVHCFLTFFCLGYCSRLYFLSYFINILFSPVYRRCFRALFFAFREIILSIKVTVTSSLYSIEIATPITNISGTYVFQASCWIITIRINNIDW